MNGPVILVGFMGTGKSDTGRRLARKLGWTFTDLDQAVVRAAGLSIPEIFEREGEEGFRRRERRALLESLKTPEQVVACGGGVVTVPENLELLRAQPWVFRLRARPETVFARVGGDPNRPLLRGEGNPVDRIRELLAAREPLYAPFARQIDTDGFRASEVAERMASEFRK